MMIDEQMDDETRDDDAGTAPEDTDASRRDFIKKLPYVAPVIQTFLFSEGTLASGNDRGNQRNQRRNQRGVSPNPGQGNPPPPPPKKDDDD